MITPNENLWSRRAFMKSALVGAATAMVSIDAHAGYPDIDLQHPSPGSKATSLSDVSQLVRNKEVSPVELTRECLRRIEQLNPKLNAFITVSADSALVDARAAEA